MPKEIERKFRTSTEDWRQEATNGTDMTQGYLSRARERTVRVRVAGEFAFLTVKGITTGASRSEYEYYVPLPHGREMLALCEPPLLEKTRFEIPYSGHVFQVDEFRGDNQGLVVVEVEVSKEDEEVDLPSWTGKEVTDDPRYFNVNLMEKPYSKWGAEG
jgi:adenylate cyclase